MSIATRFPRALPPLLMAGLAAWSLHARAQASGQPASAAAYPDKPITFIVPQGPGGANDTIARIVTQKLAVLLKQGMVVENRSGAGGNLGTAAAAKARPDGYTLLFTTNSAQVINPWLYRHTGFDPVKDFEPVSSVATAGYVLVAHPAFKPANARELVAHVKAAPKGTVTYASSGNGTLNHLAVAMLEKAGGFEMVHIPYRSAAAAAADVVGGQVPLSVQSLPSSIAFIRAGKLKVLGVVNEKRLATLPDVPTLGETFPGFGTTPWYGVFAPAGTPRAVIQRLQAAIAEALDSADVKDQLAQQGCEPFKRDAEAFGRMVQAELPLWSRIVKETGATLD